MFIRLPPIHHFPSPLLSSLWTRFCPFWHLFTLSHFFPHLPRQFCSPSHPTTLPTPYPFLPSAFSVAKWKQFLFFVLDQLFHHAISKPFGQNPQRKLFTQPLSYTSTIYIFFPSPTYLIVENTAHYFAHTYLSFPCSPILPFGCLCDHRFSP